MKKRKKPTQKAIEKLNQIEIEISNIWSGNSEENDTDVLGSYTGNPKSDAQPVQDADDL